VANAIRKGSLSRDEIWTVELAVGSKSFVDMLRMKMVAAPRKEPVAHLHENSGGYGQDKHENMIEWEVVNSSDF
jgi:putative transposase